MVAGASEGTRAPFDDGEPSRSWRGRLKATSVALIVLAAAGFWGVALFSVFVDGSNAGGRNGLAGATGPSAVERPDAPSLFVQLGRVIPVENPLSAELDHIGQDATSAARFLVGRLPSTLAANDPGIGPR
jgi:hypothetical protein